MSSSIKNIDIEDYNGIPVEGQIWDIDRVYRVCCSDTGRQVIEINFEDYCEDGIPCLEANIATANQYKSYLGVIPGKVLADIYDKYGNRLLDLKKYFRLKVVPFAHRLLMIDYYYIYDP